MMGKVYDAILVVSFGGPEKPDDVMPFLENVTRGRNIPRERLTEVAEHYYHFGGKSPINDQNRALIAALGELLKRDGPDLPIYWGNRNWHPLLPDALRQMRDDGVKRALGLFTSAFSSYSGCRQYRENIADARSQVAGAPEVDKLRMFYNHPGFIEAMSDRVRAVLRPGAHVAFTAHSIPLAMAAGCAYERQLAEAARLIADACGVEDYSVVYQSRSGPPSQPWLEPDILDHMRALADSGKKNIVVAPIGFLSDHMEVLFDLDTEARDLAAELGMQFARAGTAGTHPAFVAMIRDLIRERMEGWAERPALGAHGPSWDVCPVDCCMPGPRRPV